MNLSEFRIVITGASSGFGEEFAKQFHALGASLLLIARREERLEMFAKELNAKRSNLVKYQTCDLGKYDERFRLLVRQLEKEPCDILINNAGFGSLGRFEKLSLDRELEMVSVNVSATLRLAHAVIPGMKQKGAGCIVSISSIAGFQPLPYMATYAATKAFNYQHSLALREELKEYGIRVITVCPGPVPTEFGSVSGFKRSMPGLPSDTVEGVVEETISAIQRNKRLLVPCLGAKLLAWGSHLCPKALSTKLAGQRNKMMIDE